MAASSSSLDAFPADGYTARWRTWDGEHEEVLTLRWENEAWTVTGEVGRERIQYVARISPTWHVRQLLLFRDLAEPDLWLATDGRAHWGEMNGEHRAELDGCHDVHLPCTPFTLSLPIKRLPIAIGDRVEVPVVTVDVETLAVVPNRIRYERIAERRWRIEVEGSGTSDVVDLDRFGLLQDLPEQFRRH